MLECMTNSFIIPALLKRRIELVAEIEQAEERLRLIIADVSGLDTTIRLFDSDYKAESMKSKQLRPHREWTGRGELIRIVLDILRQAAKPMTTTEIACGYMKKRELATGDRGLFQIIRRRVGDALREQRHKGTVRSQQEPGQQMLWEINQ